MPWDLSKSILNDVIWLKKKGSPALVLAKENITAMP